MVPGQRIVKSDGRPGAKWSRRGSTDHKRVLTWFVSRRPQTPAEASLEASLEIQCPQGAERPCYEADNSACRGEWRREAGSQCAPNVSTGKRAWRTPIPQFAPVLPQGGAGTFCFPSISSVQQETVRTSSSVEPCSRPVNLDDFLADPLNRHCPWFMTGNYPVITASGCLAAGFGFEGLDCGLLATDVSFTTFLLNYFV